MSKANKLVIATFIYVMVCLLTTLIIKPYSIINFIGPAAGVASAFIIVWGSRALFCIIFGTIAFSFILLIINGAGIDFPIFLIAILAILLQSFWTKQLTYRIVRQQRWLKSRTVLFSFILKIGPVAGLISASSVVVIAMLDVKIIDNSIAYIFMSSWAGSILTSIFFIPILLFIQGAQQLSRAKRFFVIFASILGGLSIAILFKISQNAHQHFRVEQFQKSQQNIELFVNKEIEHISEQVNALAALFQSSDHVSFEEFSTFSSRIYHENSSIRALEWAPLIENEYRSSFENSATKELGVPYEIKQELMNQDVITALEKPEYFPIYYIYPQKGNVQAQGLDLMSHPDNKVAIHSAFKLNKLVASAPLTLIQDSYANPSLIVFYPVLNNPSLNPFNDNSSDKYQKLNGYIIAVVQFESIFQKLTETDSAKNVNLIIQDITSSEPFLLFGRQLDNSGRLSETLEITVFARKWRICVTEKAPWINQPKSWQTWMLLLGGTTGGIIFQLLILMMAAYSVELSHQVVLKTKELMSAKQSSDDKNLAKSNFLQTLSSELRTPIYAIKYFIAKFRQHPTYAQAEISMADIDNASHNLTQLIDTVIDLTEIESGATDIIQINVFDFHHFLQRIETLLNATNKDNNLKFTFLINENVPHLIASDELRIQKLMVALAESAAQLLNTNELNLSIKGHIHQFKRVSLFMVVTPSKNYLTEIEMEQNEKHLGLVDSDLSSFSTNMAMVKKWCQLFDGDVKLTQLPTGLVVLSASIKVDLSPEGHVFTQDKQQD